MNMIISIFHLYERISFLLFKGNRVTMKRLRSRNDHCCPTFLAPRERGFSFFMILAFLMALPACVGINTFPMIARPGDTISVMVGGSEKASKGTVSASLTDANGQTWDLKSLGLVRSVFNLRTDGRAYGQHYSSYSESTFPWAYGHEPMQTVLVTDLPAGAALGQASLSVALNTTDNSAGVSSPYTINLEIIGGAGAPDSFSTTSAIRTGPVDFGRLEPAPNAKISFGATSTIGAVSLVVSFDSTVVNPDDLNVYCPESTVRSNGTATGVFGTTQRMVYWRHDSQKIYVDVVAPQGILAKYLKLYIVHPKGLTGLPNFTVFSSAAYAVDGSVLAVQPTLSYSP
jgi:hypothetical protein